MMKNTLRHSRLGLPALPRQKRVTATEEDSCDWVDPMVSFLQEIILYSPS